VASKAKDQPQITLFRDWTSTYVGCNEGQVAAALSPEFGRPFELWAHEEIWRIRNEIRCRFCDSSMTVINLRDGYNRLFMCPSCGYFGGDGARHAMVGHYSRGLVAKVVELPLDSPEVSPDEIIHYLKSLPQHLLRLSPARAEKVVAELLKDSLSCDVRPVGGVKDKGVDAYIVSNAKIKTIIQIKWHESRDKAESVGVVREIAGTLLARGIPHGLLVTTRHKISSEAEREIAAIEQREIKGLGRMRIDTRTYQDIISMLELATARLGNTERYLDLLHEAALHSGFDTINGRITRLGDSGISSAKHRWGKGAIG
jgi:hypothetical protein